MPGIIITRLSPVFSEDTLSQLTQENPLPLVLYSYRRCPFAIRVRVTLEEKNLTYLTLEEKLSAKSPELLRMHPEGRVPLLLHGTLVFYESSIITEYLEDQFPDPPLMPKSAELRAKTRLLTYWCNTVFKTDLDIYKYRFNQLGLDEKNSLKTRFLRYFKQIENELLNNPYLLGNELTLADIHVFPFFRQLTKTSPNFPEFHHHPVINAWLDRITERPSFKAAMEKK